MYVDRWSGDAVNDTESFSSATTQDKSGTNIATGQFSVGDVDERFPNVEDILDRLTQKTKAT